jgi:uncharacterized membrane protein YbaN (DUF454 family)
MDPTTPNPFPPAAPPGSATATRRWQRVLWLVGGFLALTLGLIGAFLPLLPTTPFVLLAAWCFSRGSQRWEHWLLHHRRWGPMVRNWRANRAVPLRAKQLATLMMSLSSLWAWSTIASGWRWMPALCCSAVACWLWSLPSTPASQDGLRSQDRPPPG